MKALFREFKEFALGGNLIEIGVALVLALALTDLIRSLVDNVILQIVAAVFGQPDFSSVGNVDLGKSVILFGAFLTSLVAFLSIAFSVYFLVVKPYRSYQSRGASVEEEPDAGPSEVELLTEIRDALQRR